MLAGVEVGAAGQPAPKSAPDQLQAAQAPVDRAEPNLVSVGWPSVPHDCPHADDINKASRQFTERQLEMFRQRDAIARKQAKLFHEHMKVPPPLPPSEPAPEPLLTRLDVPLPFWPGINFSMSVGGPKISVGVGVKGEALSCIGASYKVQAAYAAKDNSLVVATPLEVSASFGSEKVKVAGSYQLLGAAWTGADQQNVDEGGKKPVGTEISVGLLQVNAGIGYSTDRTLSLSVGYDFVKTPEAFSKIVDVSVGVDARVEAPVVVHGLTQGGKYGLPMMVANYSAKIARLLTEPVPCPHCSAQGDLVCPTCHNDGTIVCPDCGGKTTQKCPRCYGLKKVDCPDCKGSGKEKCRACGGKGRLRCPYCRGTGQVTVWEEETVTRERTVLLPGGFDSAGQPIYIESTQPETCTERVPHREWCSGCDGSGLGATCGACNGTGKVACDRCRGTGKIECKTCDGMGWIVCEKCRGKGKIPCPTCRGKDLMCPLCKGRKTLGQ